MKVNLFPFTVFSTKFVELTVTVNGIEKRILEDTKIDTFYNRKCFCVSHGFISTPQRSESINCVCLLNQWSDNTIDKVEKHVSILYDEKES